LPLDAGAFGLPLDAGAFGLALDAGAFGLPLNDLVAAERSEAAFERSVLLGIVDPQRGRGRESFSDKAFSMWSVVARRQLPTPLASFVQRHLD
jgi:hypothetical protein